MHLRVYCAIPLHMWPIQVTFFILIAQPPAISPQQGAKNKRLCVGGSMFYVTALNSSSNSPNPPDKMKDLSINDNWMLSERKDNLSSEKQTDNLVSRSKQTFSPSNHDEINETSTFEKVPATDDKPVIVSCLFHSS